MNSILTKKSATIKATRQEFAIIEKALKEYYWSNDIDQSQRKVIQYMLTDIQITRIADRKEK